MSIPGNMLEGLPENPARPPRSNSLASYWLKEPFYMTRWTYLHRPSVWTRMGGARGFEWHGAYGFKSLLAGQAGIGWQGGARRVPFTMRWLLGGAGGGLERVGRQFTRVGMGAAGGVASRPLLAAGAYTQMAGRSFAGRSAVRGAGAAGVLRGFGAVRAADIVERAAGGFVTNVGKFTLDVSDATITRAATYAATRGYGTASLGAITTRYTRYGGALEGRIAARVGRAGIGGLVAPRRAARRVLTTLTPEERLIFHATGKAGRTALKRGLMWRGASRVMAGASVAMNIALFGSILSSLAHAGTRAIGEAALNFGINDRIQRLEFGGGVDPFTQTASLTERQRALQEIQRSSLNARRFMGNEAGLMHA